MSQEDYLIWTQDLFKSLNIRDRDYVMVSLEEILPILTIISFAIAIGVIIYHFGKWRQKTEIEREETKRVLEAISKKVEKIPEEFWSKFIDAYEMLEKTKDSSEKAKKEKSQK